MAKKTDKKKQDLKLEDSGLTLVQEQVAVALAMGSTMVSISTQYDISLTTIKEWRATAEFATYMKAILRDKARETRGQLAEMKDAALTTLKTLMADGKEEVQLKAACYILDTLAGEVKDAKKLKAQARKLYEKGR